MSSYEIVVLLFGMPGGWEWVIIALVILLLFGARRIPELARGLGRGIREFKDATRGLADEVNKQAEDIAEDLKRQEAPYPEKNT
ncbi:MAG: twin-arginine translocase TatA/TatE family subunit [Cytophagales bacterium]|nr:twin-arginine translocase TatA/TatE family subunit [Cytophagales bacterium]